MGDGECNEGSIWEALLLAPQLKLGNLTVLVDYNSIQSLGRTEEIIDQRNLPERLKTLGWETADVNGHDLDAVLAALEKPQAGPKAIVLRTVKGKGVSLLLR